MNAPLVIPRLRPELHGVDLVVGVLWPTLREHASPHASADSLGVCTVQPADGSSFGFPVACGTHQQDLWDALHVLYLAGARFRAVATVG